MQTNHTTEQTENHTAASIDYMEIADELGGGRTVAYKPFLAHACGGAITGLLLSQFWYYANMETVHSRGGWFYKTQSEITEETGLTRTETEGARKKLVATGILSEQLRGIPARMWYKVNKDRLFEVLHLHLNPVTAAMGAGSAEVTERLIAIYKSSLKSLSQLGFSRAVKLGVKAEMVDYEEIMRRDCGLCHVCGQTITQGPGQKRGDLQFDHVHAISTGGEHIAENIKVSHASCNYEKSNKPLPVRVSKASMRDSRKLAVTSQSPKNVGVAQAITKTSSENTQKIHQRVAPAGVQSFSPSLSQIAEQKEQKEPEPAPVRAPAQKPEPLPERLDPNFHTPIMAAYRKSRAEMSKEWFIRQHGRPSNAEDWMARAHEIVAEAEAKGRAE